jgi:hypothetical protein
MLAVSDMTQIMDPRSATDAATNNRRRHHRHIVEAPEASALFSTQ